jgi:hypothetical protein
LQVGKWDRAENTLQPATSGAFFCLLGFLELAVVHSFFIFSRKTAPNPALHENSEPTLRGAVLDFYSVNRNLLTCGETLIRGSELICTLYE